MNTDNTTTNGENNSVAVTQRTLFHTVLDRIKDDIENERIRIPVNYAYENTLRIAWLIIQNLTNKDGQHALQVCTQISIINAMLKMVLNGLNPQKNQCSFIMYGNTLECEFEYAGKILVAKRDAGVKDIVAHAVFKDDKFEFEVDATTLKKRVKVHEQTLESMGSGEVKGAYCMVTFENGETKTEIMPMSQIRAAWAMGATGGNSKAHKNFPDQMAIKTVIGRALKIDSNSSDDAALFGDPTDRKFAQSQAEINDQANQQVFEPFGAVEETTAEVVNDIPEQQPILSEQKTEPAANGTLFSNVPAQDKQPLKKQRGF